MRHQLLKTIEEPDSIRFQLPNRPTQSEKQTGQNLMISACVLMLIGPFVIGLIFDDGPLERLVVVLDTAASIFFFLLGYRIFFARSRCEIELKGEYVYTKELLFGPFFVWRKCKMEGIYALDVKTMKDIFSSTEDDDEDDADLNEFDPKWHGIQATKDGRHVLALAPFYTKEVLTELANELSERLMIPTAPSKTASTIGVT